MRSHPRHWICILFHAPTVGQSTLATTFAYHILVGGSCCDTPLCNTTGFSRAGLVFGFALGASMWLELHDDTLFEPPSKLGACLARLRSLLKIGLFGASFDFASVKLVVSSVSQLWRNSTALHCASNSELHFRQSQKERSESLW